MQIRIMEMIDPPKAYKLRYYFEHKYCPKCGYEPCISTLVSYPFDSNDPTSFKDLNRCSCGKCGDVHTMHDRLKYNITNGESNE